MAELTVKIPNDLAREFKSIPTEEWQLLFSRFVREKLIEIRNVDAIVSKSKAGPEKIKELSYAARSSIAKKFLER